MKYGNPSIWKKFASSPFTLIGLLILLFFFTKATLSIQDKARFSAERLENAQIELNKLESHQEELARQIGYLSTEQGVEAELRTKYRATKDGESVAVIVDDKSTTTVSATKNSANTAVGLVKENQSLGWWGRLLRMVGF